MRCTRPITGIALGCLLVVAGGCSLLPDGKFKQFQKIQPGMTLAQAQEIMGPPKHVDPPVVLKEGEAPTQFFVWESRRERMVATVSADGKVVNTGYSSR
jgi:hypothetical protein